MRAGQLLTLCGSDAAAGAKEWRDVAEQYQSAIEQKESCVYFTQNSSSKVFVDDPQVGAVPLGCLSHRCRGCQNPS